jgi:hypothetical protein
MGNGHPTGNVMKKNVEKSILKLLLRRLHEAIWPFGGFEIQMFIGA